MGNILISLYFLFSSHHNVSQCLPTHPQNFQERPGDNCGRRCHHGQLRHHPLQSDRRARHHWELCGDLGGRIQAQGGFTLRV